MLIFSAIYLELSTFMFIFANEIRQWKETYCRTRLMKTNRIMDEIRASISPEMKLQMEMSVAIANRIYEILEAKGMTQKDLAIRLGKTETEVSRWLSGTHNLTLSTICKISAALEEEIVSVPHQVLEPEFV